MLLSFNSERQADNTGKMEFQEFKVFWEKMKKWIVRESRPTAAGSRVAAGVDLVWLSPRLLLPIPLLLAGLFLALLLLL